MSTKRSAGRSASTQQKVRFTFKPKKDRSPNLCAFAFTDGRQCRTPRCSGHLHFCYFHAQKEAQSLAAQQVGEDISRFLPTKLLTACDLGVAMSRLFCAVAQGQVKPKVASTLAYLAQTMLQSIPIAQHEYINSFDTNTWRSAVRASFRFDAPPSTPTRAPEASPQPSASTPASQPAQPSATPAGCHPERSEGSAFSSSSAPFPTPACASAPSPVCHPERSAPSAFRTNLRNEGPASSSNSSLATHHSPVPPAPSPHTPLPPTSAEFFQQVVAGLPRSKRPGSTGKTGSFSSSSSPASSSSAQTEATSTAPRPVAAGLQPGSSESSPAPAPSSASSSSDSVSAHTFPTQPAPSSPCTPPTPNNSQPAPTPPAPPCVPPGFGAPANWDALIPPKPRLPRASRGRRFSRHWHLLD